MPKGTERSCSRRSCIAAIGAIGLSGLAGCSGGSNGTTATDEPTSTQTSTSSPTATSTATKTATATPAGSDTYEEWMSDVPNFEEMTDMTGQSQVEILVGAEGGLVFGPPAVEISTGTEVTWTWTGKGGSHNVVHDGGEFETDVVSDEGHTFSYTFSEAGLYKYYCDPHERMGMKGVVSVTD